MNVNFSDTIKNLCVTFFLSNLKVQNVPENKVANDDDDVLSHLSGQQRD